MKIQLVLDLPKLFESLSALVISQVDDGTCPHCFLSLTSVQRGRVKSQAVWQPEPESRPHSLVTSAMLGNWTPFSRVLRGTAGLRKNFVKYCR